MYSYNTTTHTSTNFIPYELMFGIKPNLPSSILKPPEFKYTYDNYLDALTLKLQKSREIARNNLLQSKQTHKGYYDKNVKDVNFSEAQYVYLLNEKTKQGCNKKLTQNYTGPYKILEVNLPVNCTIEVGKRRMKVHMNKLKHAFVAGAALPGSR